MTPWRTRRVRSGLLIVIDGEAIFAPDSRSALSQLIRSGAFPMPPTDATDPTTGGPTATPTTTTPAPAAPQTIGDVLAAKKAADSDRDAKKAAVAKANQEFADSETAAASADEAFKADLKATGPIIDQSGSAIDVYIPDNSDVGYSLIHPVPVTTTVTAAPAPTGETTGAPTTTDNPALNNLFSGGSANGATT